jgi:hypothetical protein
VAVNGSIGFQPVVSTSAYRQDACPAFQMAARLAPP